MGKPGTHRHGYRLIIGLSLQIRQMARNIEEPMGLFSSPLLGLRRVSCLDLDRRDGGGRTLLDIPTQDAVRGWKTTFASLDQQAASPRSAVAMAQWNEVISFNKHASHHVMLRSPVNRRRRKGKRQAG